eukprot:TRINITY_DN27759_c0_g1_i1.p1 TRINITY_DN27759_c0_g1~~TRINITY_DN27759_c0_g1_i1.p1  ORF type:complete len:134 (+),score=14.69 TRINITY_DN27759_c0_g1_i1:47-403(+)
MMFRKLGAMVVAAAHFIEAILMIAYPGVYATRLEHDGEVLCRLLGVLHVGCLVGCLLFALGRCGGWALFVSWYFHASCWALYAFDVFIDSESGYTRSSFGFMMLVHAVSFLLLTSLYV